MPTNRDSKPSPVSVRKKKSKNGTVKLTLPLKAPPLNQNSQRRAHWTQVAKAKREVEEVVVVAVKKARLKKIDAQISARLVWFAPDARNRDCDSLAPMMKACLDALVKKSIIPDDNSKIVREVHLGPVIVARDNPRFELWLTVVEGSPVLPG